MLAAYVAATQGRYLIQNDFSGSGFFDNFDFWTANDPTNGYVDYVSRADAEAWGLIKASSAGVYIGADHSSVSSGRGRAAVRITSKQSYNSGLFLADLTHMPSGCTTADLIFCNPFFRNVAGLLVVWSQLAPGWRD
jgi:hypothetical protein